jgi:elongation factor Ts
MKYHLSFSYKKLNTNQIKLRRLDMAVTAGLVKELREMTGAGMMDCKKALSETNGNIDEAVEVLRKKGLGKAAKKSDRLASEGLVTVEVNADFTKATMSEINSETDFVAKNDEFINLTKDTTCHIQAESVESVEDLMKTTINGTVFEEYFNTKVATIGENLVVRRFATVSADGTGVVNGYCHSNGRVAVIVAANCDSAATAEGMRDLLKDVSMHAAAMSPKYLKQDEVPADVLEKEKEIAIELLKKENKPEKIWDNILKGKMAKYKNENSLLGQSFVKDDKKTVSQVLEARAKELGGTVELVEYVRFELGEGLEKKACDFAEEVAAQLS